MGAYCLSIVPYSTKKVIEQTACFWTSLLGYFINNERVEIYEFAAMALSYVGVVGIILSKRTINDNKIITTGYPIGVLFALVQVLFTSSSNVLNRKLKNVHYAVVMFYVSLWGIFMNSLVLMTEYTMTPTDTDFRVYTLQ